MEELFWSFFNILRYVFLCIFLFVSYRYIYFNKRNEIRNFRNHIDLLYYNMYKIHDGINNNKIQYFMYYPIFDSIYFESSIIINDILYHIAYKENKHLCVTKLLIRECDYDHETKSKIDKTRNRSGINITKNYQHDGFLQEYRRSVFEPIYYFAYGEFSTAINKTYMIDKIIPVSKYIFKEEYSYRLKCTVIHEHFQKIFSDANKGVSDEMYHDFLNLYESYYLRETRKNKIKDII